MKTFASLVVAAAALASPLASFAQTNAPLTRAEVRADLIRVEQAGYNPSTSDDTRYPADIQAAEAKIAAADNQRMAHDAMGGVPANGTSAAGSRRLAPHPAPAACVGPVSFCNPYFGG